MDTTGIWKWLAAFLAGAMVAGAPSYVFLLSKPSREDIQEIERTMTALQIQQAQVAEQILSLQQQINRFLAEQASRPGIR